MTKQQRKDIYWAAMFEIVGFGLGGLGLCHTMTKLWAFGPDELASFGMSELPELMTQRPENKMRSAYWFPKGTYRQQRLECLSRAIDLLEK